MRLLILSTLLALATCREKRFIGLPSLAGGLSSIGSLFGSQPQHESPPKYPVWKVHKYSGIHLKPVTHEELAAASPPIEHSINEFGVHEVDGYPPKVVQLPEYHPEPYSLDPYPAADGDTRAALAAIDSLGAFGSFLPDAPKGRTGRSTEAEDRVGLVRLPLKIKKKALLALLRKGKKGGLGGGIGGIGGLGGIGGGFSSLTGGFSGLSSGLSSGLGLQSLVNYFSPQEAEGPYPGHTTVYRTPTSTGFLSGLSLGGGSSTHQGIPVELPEPSLPEIPQLTLVPEAPKLPQLTLPGNYKLPYSTGSYVTIKVPKPPLAPAPVYGPPQPEYGLPAQEYSLPLTQYGPPANEYGPPPAPIPEYGIPAAPTLEYGTPKETYTTDSIFQLPHYQTPHDNFVPSAPAPPVYNSYQTQVTSYQAPVFDNFHNLDTNVAVQGGVYPPSPSQVATATYSYYPPAQGYSYDNTHSPSEQQTSIVVPDSIGAKGSQPEASVQSKQNTNDVQSSETFSESLNNGDASN